RKPTGTGGYDFNGFGNPVADPTKTATTFVYDKLGRQRVTVVNPGHGDLTRGTRADYDKGGNLTPSADEPGNPTRYEYDLLNRRTKATDALDHSNEVVYDLDGNVLETVDAANKRTTNVYDALNQLVSKETPDGRVTGYTYTAAGQVRQETGAAHLPI